MKTSIVSSLLPKALAAALVLLASPPAASRADILYVANYSNATIEKFTTSGSASLFASSGLSNPEFLAFTNDAGVPLPLANQAAVPEPSTWAMLAGGVAMLSGVQRFRRGRRG